MTVDRRRLLQRSLAMGGMLGLGGCAMPGKARRRNRPASITRIFPPRWRPSAPIPTAFSTFAAASGRSGSKAPISDTEQIGDALVVHNYGHGGSGWSLSWGSANIAVQKAMSVAPKRDRRDRLRHCRADLGDHGPAGRRPGHHLYPRVYSRTRSVRANGSWTPDSRICADASRPGRLSALCGKRWRAISYKTFRGYMGLPGRPIDFADQYRLSDTPIDRARRQAGSRHHRQLCHDRHAAAEFRIRRLQRPHPRSHAPAADAPRRRHAFPGQICARATKSCSSISPLMAMCCWSEFLRRRRQDRDPRIPRAVRTGRI